MLKYVYRILVVKLKRKNTFGRSNYRRDDNNKTDLKEMRFEGADYIRVVLYRNNWRPLANT
jgi:hypothetical protein